MLLVYVSGPYRDSRGEYYVKQNIRAAEDVAVKLWRMGYAVICPHKNTEMLGGACGPDEPWIKGDLLMVRRCDLVVMMGDWQRSEGAKLELSEARLRNIPIFYWPSEKQILLDIANGNRPVRRPAADELVHDCYSDGSIVGSVRRSFIDSVESSDVAIANARRRTDPNYNPNSISDLRNPAVNHNL